MKNSLLALDPGTHSTGWALFDGEKLTAWESIEAPRGGEIEDRIPAIIQALDEVADNAAPPVAHVAIEKPRGVDGRRPAPELQTLIGRIRRWARARKLGWTAYSQSTVAASVRPRGARRGGAKRAILTGVEALYPETRDRWDGKQDSADAVAVGHCHLTKSREAGALEGR